VHHHACAASLTSAAAAAAAAAVAAVAASVTRDAHGCVGYHRLSGNGIAINLFPFGVHNETVPLFTRPSEPCFSEFI